jgi:hypothetical protein
VAGKPARHFPFLVLKLFVPTMNAKSTKWNKWEVIMLTFAIGLAIYGWRTLTRSTPAVAANRPPAAETLPRRSVSSSMQKAVTEESMQSAMAAKLRRRMDALLATAVDGNQPNLIRQFCQEMTLDTLPSYLALLTRLEPEVYGYLTREELDLAIHRRWLELSPTEALSHAAAAWDGVDAMPGEVMTDKMEFMLEDLALKFPKLAQEQYQWTTSEADRYALLENLAPKNPGFVFSELEKLADNDRRQTAVRRIVYRLMSDAGNDASQVYALTSWVQDAAIKTQIELQIISQQGDKSPGPALQRLVKIPFDSPSKAELGQALFHKWLTTDSLGAVNWFEQNEPGLAPDVSRKYYDLLVASLSPLPVQK